MISIVRNQVETPWLEDLGLWKPILSLPIQDCHKRYLIGNLRWLALESVVRFSPDEGC